VSEEQQVPPAQPPAGERLYTESDLAVLDMFRQLHSGARMFYIIAAFSVVNSLLAILKVKVWFIGALGITRILDVLALGMPGGGTFWLWLFNVSLAGSVFACGYYAKRPSRAAYWAGYVLYSLDALLCLATRQWFDLAFHAWFLYSLYRGLQAVNVIYRLQEETSSTPD
jgi:hypothetical protein